MIYVSMKTSLSHTVNYKDVNDFIDWLEHNSGLNPNKLDWSPAKYVVRFIAENEDILVGIEAEIIKRFNHAVEWEVYNDNSDERYIAQLLIGKAKTVIEKQYLMAFYPSDYMFEL